MPALPAKISRRAIPPASAEIRAPASSGPSGAVDATAAATIAAAAIAVADPAPRGGRPGGRFERRPSGPGGPRQDRGYQGGRSGPSRRPQLISEMLKAGQDVVIQIAKEPLGKKGARITSHVALPGRFLVYMPTVHHTGVSRKIISADNRSRLRRLVSEAGNAYPGGFIVRTAAGEATDEEIRTDIEFLGKTWNEIKERSEQRKSPALLHRDLDLVERMLRDYVCDDFSAIWIDNEEEYGKVVEFVSRFQPKLVNRVKLYTKETPIFEEFGIQHELDKALRAKVWLKSGGYIVINHTEALVAIDVNTGKFVGKGSTRLEDTIVKTNLEAVKEIVRQIRLRDLGGIIVVDFIDMEERRNREKVSVGVAASPRAGQGAVQSALLQRVWPRLHHPQAHQASSRARALPAVPVLHRLRHGQIHPHALLRNPSGSAQDGRRRPREPEPDAARASGNRQSLEDARVHAHRRTRADHAQTHHHPVRRHPPLGAVRHLLNGITASHP